MNRLVLLLLLVAIAAPATGQDLLLDKFPNTYAAYSLRKLDKDFSGSVIRVARSSDSAEQDIGLSGDSLDVSALTTFCGANDCAVVKWYSQIPGDPSLDTGHSTGGLDPHIVYGGSVVRDLEGRPVISFAGNTSLAHGSNLQTSIRVDSASIFIKFNTDSLSAGAGNYEPMFQMNVGSNTNTTLTFNAASWTQFYVRHNGWVSTSDYLSYTPGNTIFSYHTAGATVDSSGAYSRHDQIEMVAADISQQSEGDFVVGGPSKGSNTANWNGKIGEVVVMPYQTGVGGNFAVYEDMNQFWTVGPVGIHLNAVLPQSDNYMVALYNWLETIDTSAVSLTQHLPMPEDSIGVWSFDASGYTEGQAADLYIDGMNRSLSSVVKANPREYVLDNGAGYGIERSWATINGGADEVMIPHEPKDPGNDPFMASYPGNPPRSWANETCFWYNYHAHRRGLSEGNKLYKNKAVARRALVVAIVDMMMYDANFTGSLSWQRNYGKAMVSWAETLDWCGEVLDPTTRAAYETGLKKFVDRIRSGTSANNNGINTNMAMFSIDALAHIYVAAEDSTLKAHSLEAVKRYLLGYTDGEIGTKHDVGVLTNMGAERVGGVFSPAGYIMEGGQPDYFYQGESLYWVVHALSVLARDYRLGVPSEWSFLEAVADSMSKWEAYQVFADFGTDTHQSPPAQSLKYSGGTSYSGRTGKTAPGGQAGTESKYLNNAYFSSHALWRAADPPWSAGNNTVAPSIGSMKSGPGSWLNTMKASILSESTISVDPWEGGSPWAKKNRHAPPTGWYTYLNNRMDADTLRMYPPSYRKGEHYNLPFGGYPTGPEFWAYKNEGSDGQKFAVFIEVDEDQGPAYGGWYGGKIETFWADSTGPIIMNHHAKTGCDLGGSSEEDSSCPNRSVWENIAAHHVWGSPVSDSVFTTTNLKGWRLDRTTTWNLGAGNPNVSINNAFNDKNHAAENGGPDGNTSGELNWTGDGMWNRNHRKDSTFTVTSTFTAVATGIQVEHAITSAGTDSLLELYASIPVYSRNWDSSSLTGQQGDMDDADIDYWNGSAWTDMPTTDGGDADSYPDYVTTGALRLCRDIGFGWGPRCAYVNISGSESVRLSNAAYEPAQVAARFRVVHFDLHTETPGTYGDTPISRTLTYTIQTTDPTN